ncbi:MAG: hypothetical protein V5A45_03285 [Haloarculaceae archaeon]
MADFSTIMQILIVGGTVAMVAAILYTRKLFEQLSENTYQRRWRGLFGLMAFFLVGYVAALGVVVTGYEGVFQVVTGLVFLFGALFVFLVVNTGLVTVNDLQDKMEAAREARQEAESARKEAEVTRAETMETYDYLQKKADDYAEIMRECASGDLTRRMEPDGENEAMEQICDNFNEMIQELEMTTGQLETFAEEVEDGGRSVQEGSEAVRDASEQVAESIQKISDDLYEQQERLQNISEEMDTMTAEIESSTADNPDVGVKESVEHIKEIMV